MFATVQFESWDALRNKFGRRALWAFRGHADSKWALETSIYREAQRQNTQSRKNLLSRESWMLYQFQRFAHHHRGDLPPERNVADWLALIQHYGGPTRLLDFTYSLYVAAFFATESAESEAAVWCIDTDALSFFAREKLDAHRYGSITDIRRSMTKRFNALRLQEEVPQGVLHVEPDRLHERMYQQQGLFLAPTNPDLPFLDNLAALLGCEASIFCESHISSWSEELGQRLYLDETDHPLLVVKLLLPKHWHEEIQDDLRYMNISAATLFPGFEGFARSLKRHL